MNSIGVRKINNRLPINVHLRMMRFDLLINSITKKNVRLTIRLGLEHSLPGFSWQDVLDVYLHLHQPLLFIFNGRLYFNGMEKTLNAINTLFYDHLLKSRMNSLIELFHQHKCKAVILVVDHHPLASHRFSPTIEAQLNLHDKMLLTWSRIVGLKKLKTILLQSNLKS